MEIQVKPFTDKLKKQVFEGFGRHAVAETGHNELPDPIAFIAKENDQFVGALVAQMFWGALHIKYVYIEDAFRSKGVGSQLLEAALAYAKEQKCPFAFVETMSFQAMPFYKKFGFVLEYTRHGYNHGTSFHYLRKDL